MGTSISAAEGILRRSTAMGLGGLAIALLVGVMSFAFTTEPAGPPNESASRYLPVPGRALDLSAVTSSASRITERAAALIGPSEVRAHDVPAAVRDGARESRTASVVTRSEPLPALPANDRPFEASPLRISSPAPSVQSLTAERTPLTPEATAIAAIAAVPPAEVAVSAEPVLAPGDRITATVSFYYCERGEQGHPGDGGNFCGVMRDGSVVYSGAAACAYTYLGQRFRIVGDPTERVYQCADTGSAVHGLHRDIWFMTSDEGWAWQAQVGQLAELEIVEQAPPILPPLP